jgi:beta-lactamase regulating signal transducer with metallopeptidase domain
MNAFQEIFTSVFPASRDAAVLTIAIGILLVALRRLPSSWRHAIWLLVVVRLLLPVLPESSLSWRNWTALTKSKNAPSPPLTFPDGADRFGALDFSGIPMERTVTSGPPTAVREASTAWTLIEILPSVWAGGTLLWLLVMAAGWISFQGRVRRLEARQHSARENLEIALATLCSDLGIARVPRLVLTDAVAGPALTGWWHPRILMPPSATEALNPSQLRMVMLHELGHLRRRDVAVNWLLCLLQAVHWFNPFVWWAFRQIRVEAERATDEWVMRRIDAESPSDYGETLIRLLETAGQGRSMAPGLVGVVESRISLRSRLAAIGRFRKKSSPWLAVAALVVVSALGTAGLTQAPTKVGDNPLDPTEWKLTDVVKDINGSVTATPELGEMSQVQLNVKVWRTGNGRPDELIASPSALTMPGQWVLFEDSTEIHYPTDYGLPSLPKDLAANAKGGGAIEGNWKTNESTAILPPHPTGFEKRNLGWTLKLRPDLGQNGEIRISGTIEQSGLKGFVDHGSPITIDRPSGLFGKRKTETVTENRQRLPVFHQWTHPLNFDQEGDLLVATLAADGGPSVDQPQAIVEGFADSLRVDGLPGLRVEVLAKPLELPSGNEATGKKRNIESIYVTTRFVETDLNLFEGEWNLGSSLLTDPQFQVLIRALSQRKGVDLLLAPSISLSDGESKVLEVTRDFVYPNDYSPPVEAKESIKAPGSFPASPATPKDFRKIPLGVQYQVKATLLPDNRIELDLSPRISELREYLNYGGTIWQAGNGKPTGVIVSENKIMMPVVDAKSQRMIVQVADGQTVVLGGFVQERELQIVDRLPVIGLVADSKKTVERRFIFAFVTARLLDAD